MFKNKVQIAGTVELQEPIEGVDYSKNGFILTVTKYVDASKEEEGLTELNTLLSVAVARYFDQLKKKVQSSRNTMIDKLRVEVSEEYEDKMAKAKRIILSQREELNKLREPIK